MRGEPSAIDYARLIGLHIRMERPVDNGETVGMEALVEQVYDEPWCGSNRVVIVGDDGNTATITVMDRERWRFTIRQPPMSQDC